MNAKPVNVGIIGSGNRAIGVCHYLETHPEITCLKGVADLVPEKAETLLRRFGWDCQITTDYNVLLADPEIDAIILATPDHLHVQPAVDTLKAGKHILLEKPMATTLEDCDTIMQAGENSSACCYLGFSMRHSVVHEKIYEMVQTGKLGKITTIEANEWNYNGRTYFRRWNRFRKYGGGIWLTKATHDFDLMNWIAGGTPKRVFATSNLSHYQLKEGAGPRCRECAIKESCPDFYDISATAEDDFEDEMRRLQLKMPQEGELAPDICLYNSDKDTFDNGICVVEYDNDIRATYTVNLLAAKINRMMTVVGTEGMVELDTNRAWLRFTQRHSGEVMEYDLREEVSDAHGGADERIFNDFFRICVEGGTPRSGLQDGRMAVALALAARDSDDADEAVSLKR